MFVYHRVKCSTLLGMHVKGTMKRIFVRVEKSISRRQTGSAVHLFVGTKVNGQSV